MKKTYITYILIDKGVPFYVGKGNSLSRAFSHEKYARSGDLRDLGYGLTCDYNPHKTRKIKRMIREGRELLYKVYYHSTETDAFAHEIHLIYFLGRAREGGLLCNIMPGGTGGSILNAVTSKQKADIIDRRSATLRSRSLEDKEKSQTKRRITLATKSEEDVLKTKQKLSAAGRRYWAGLSEEERAAFCQKRAASSVGKKMGPSPKAGLPATGNNAKGVRRAWNEGLSYDDPRYDKHKEGMAKYLEQRDQQWSGRTPFRLVSPSGELVEGNSLSWLIATHNVTSRIRFLIRGEVIAYKKWKRADN